MTNKIIRDIVKRRYLIPALSDSLKMCSTNGLNLSGKSAPPNSRKAESYLAFSWHEVLNQQLRSVLNWSKETFVKCSIISARLLKHGVSGVAWPLSISNEFGLLRFNERCPFRNRIVSTFVTSVKNIYPNL